MPRIEARLAALNPPPVRRIPVLIAGTGLRRTTRLVARHADAWHAAFPDRPEELEAPVAALRRWCDEIGRDPTEIEWGVGIEPEDLDRFLARDAAAYLEMGFTQFTLGFNGPGWDVDAGAGFLAWRDERNAASRSGDAPIEVASALSRCSGGGRTGHGSGPRRRSTPKSGPAGSVADQLTEMSGPRPGCRPVGSPQKHPRPGVRRRAGERDGPA